MEQHDAYVQKFEAQLRELGARMEQLRARADKAEAQAKISYDKQLRELNQKKTVVEQKLEELRGAGAGAWEDLKSGFDSAWTELQKTADHMFARFK